MEAIVLAGGMGTRLKSVVSDIPKPMAPVGGRPFLEYILNYLSRSGFNKVVLSVGFKWETIENYFGNKYREMSLDYAIEKLPLGTGGGIRLALEMCTSKEVFIFNGDTFFAVNISSLNESSLSEKHKIILALKSMENFDRYGSVETVNN